LAIACALPNHISYLARLCIGHFHILRCCRSFPAASSLRRPQRESANGSLDFLYAIKAFASSLQEMEKRNGARLDTAAMWPQATKVGRVTPCAPPTQRKPPQFD